MAFCGKKKWNSKQRMIHIEWMNLSRDALATQFGCELHLHFEGDCDEIRNSLRGDSKFVELLDKSGMKIYRNLNAKKEISFPKPFLEMNEDERKNVLNKEFEMVAPLLDCVYEKCELLYG